METTFYVEKDRIAPLVGKKGAGKKFLEEKFDCKINIDSKTGKVDIEGEDSLNEYVLRNVINAISIGHSPEKALSLSDELYVQDVIDMRDYVRKDKITKMKGRVIGENGSVKRTSREISFCDISIYDSYISIIGPYENVNVLREALIMLVKGASYRTYYSYLERNKNV